MLKVNENFPPRDPTSLINISPNERLKIAENMLIIRKHFNIFSNNFGLDDFRIRHRENIRVASIFSIPIIEFYEKLVDHINGRLSDEEGKYISFILLFHHMKFFLNIIENAINVRIKDRTARHNNKQSGWNAFYASIWHHFKMTWVKQLQSDIDMCMSSCKENVVNANNVIFSILQKILKKRGFTINDIKMLESYYVDHHQSHPNNYIYGFFTNDV
jgi:hypothetical protein